MASNVSKVDAAVEDIRFATAGNGSGPASFSRVESDGAVGAASWTELSADAVPVIDRAVVSGGRTPFAGISPSTDRDVEACLQMSRINVRDMKNFEHYGGTEGTGVDVATAKRNTAVVDRILDDLAAEGRHNGIFFPGANYLFHEDDTLGGLFTSAIIGIGAANSGILLSGGGPVTRLARHASANNTRALLFFSGCGSVTVQDMTIDNLAGGAWEIDIGGSSNISDFQLNRLILSNGGINAVVSSSALVNRLWVTQCTVPSIACSNISNARFRDNVISESLGIASLSNVVATSGIQIVGNQFTGLGGISFTRILGYDAALHRDILIEGNTIASGAIAVLGFSEASILRNRLLRGGIAVDMTNMAVVSNLEIVDNTCEGSSAVEVSGVSVTCTASELFGLTISGGRLHQFQRNGIRINCGLNGIVRYPKIHGVTVLNCSREDSGTTDYDAILLVSDGAGSGCVDGLIRDNIIRATAATAVNGNYHARGVHEQGAGDHARNVVYDNHIKGYVTAAVTLTGAGSVDGNDTTHAFEDAAL